MKPAFNRLSRLSQITLAAAALTTGIAFASPVAWTGTGTDALWATAANWSPSAVPTATDDVTVGPTYTSGLTITVGGTAGTPTQINSLAFDTGTSGGNKFLASGYLQINTGNVTTAGNQAGWLDTTSIDIPATGSGVNNWIVEPGSTLRVRGNIAVIGGSGTPTITATGATGSLNLDKTPQSYAGNWDISTQSLTVKSFGSGAVKVSNVKWYTSAATSNTYSNDFTFGGFARMQAGATQTLTFDGVWTGTASDILFNTDGGGTSTGATIKLAGTPTSFTANTFQVIGTLQLDTAGYLTGVGAVALNRGNILTYGIVNWNAADTVPATTTFNNTQASTAAQLGMLATGTTTINGLYKLNSSATVTDGSDLTINTAVSGATLALAGKVTDSASTTIRALTKIGAGTAILSADTNNYRGDTTVSEGTLLVNNTSGSATGTGNVTVASGATLGGSGIISGTVTAAGTIAPGNSAGTLTAGATTLTGTLAVQIDGATGDKLVSTGVLDITGSTLTIEELGGGFTESSYTIADATGGLTGEFASVPAGYAVAYGPDQAILTKVSGSDYDTWKSDFTFAAPADSLPTADPDGDGLSNQQEYAFGLNPTLGSSVNPITSPLDKTTGTFTYTRRKLSLVTPLAYTVKTSTDLSVWAPASVSGESITTAGDIETVVVTLSGAPLGAPKLFVRVSAE